jgi:hypothetical protein
MDLSYKTHSQTTSKQTEKEALTLSAQIAWLHLVRL